MDDADPQSLTEKENRLQEFKKTLRKFWVAGVAGAYFSAVLHNLPHDLAMLWQPPHLPFELTYFLLQYGYVFWLLTYFFISSFNVDMNSKHTWWDILFDVGQSTLALAVAFKLLVFVKRDAADVLASQMLGYRFANITIFLISFVSFLMFSPDLRRNTTPAVPAGKTKTQSPKLRKIDLLRGLAAFAAMLSTLIAFGGEEPPTNLYWLGALQLLLWGVLGCYAYWTVTDTSTSNSETAAPVMQPQAPNGSV